MGPAEEMDDSLPPPMEEGEVRGPMEPYPRVEDARRRPLRQRLLDGLERRGDAVIQVYPREGVSLTAALVRERALHLAAALQEEGVRPGDRVTLLSPRHPDSGPLFLATLAAGAVWAPLNNTFDDRDLRLMLALLEPRVVLAPPDVASRVRPLLLQLQMRAAPLLVTLDEGPEWERLTRPRAPPLPPLPPPPADPRGADAVVACSSGTSGLPKGVATSHFAMIIVLETLLHENAMEGLNGKMVFTSPGFWVTGIWFTLFSMVSDMTLVYVNGCNEQEFLASVEEHKPPTIFTANNFLLSVAKMHEADPSRDISSLRHLLCGGAAMSSQAEEYVGSVMRAEVLPAYGMTELNSGIGLSRRVQKSGSVGTLAPFMRCKVVDPNTGRVQGPGEAGELRFKGPTLTSGYLNNPKASAELHDANGWLRSGDVGYYDEDGYFFITGRIKDTIKYCGAHVSPVDIEGLLEAHPAVLESAVVGVPEARAGELPRAYVVLRPGASASEEELCALVQEQSAPHKWLRGGVVFLEALPKSSTGKISRAEIRKTYVEGEQPPPPPPPLDASTGVGTVV